MIVAFLSSPQFVSCALGGLELNLINLDILHSKFEIIIIIIIKRLY